MAVVGDRKPQQNDPVSAVTTTKHEFAEIPVFSENRPFLTDRKGKHFRIGYARFHVSDVPDVEPVISQFPYEWRRNILVSQQAH
jgi:hypothetical protein